MKAKDMRTDKIRAIKKIKKSAINKESNDIDKEYEILTKLVSIRAIHLHSFCDLESS